MSARTFSNISLFYLLLAFYSSLGSDKVKIAKIPNWVNDLEFIDHQPEEGVGGYQYLLVDQQYYLSEEEDFIEYRIKLLSSEGVQEMSTINISFDPTYEQLTLHKIRVYREGKWIDKTRSSKVEVLQREKSLERSLYDGSLSAVVNLTDVRVGDILDYSYSLRGYNPIKNGIYSTDLYFQFNVPVSRIYKRIITKDKKDLKYVLNEGMSKPELKISNLGYEYIWDIAALETLIYDNNVPAWYDEQKHVSISNVRSWKDIVNWALPLYEYPVSSLSNISIDYVEGSNRKDRLLTIIRKVQDDIRYLGFEGGIGAYKPNSPDKVYKQKYGDCKDKSLLLVALLRKEGVEAYPLLVNTTAKHSMNSKLPGISVFDHCVVTFSFQDKEYFVDPTISSQGGSIDEIWFPNYTYGLKVKRGEKGLTLLPQYMKNEVIINETITLEEIGGSAELAIRSEYYGAKADNMRSYFANNSLESIQKEYLNYYSNLYSSIKTRDEIRFEDFSRGLDNKFQIIESYHIPEYWKPNADSSSIYGEVYPLVLKTELNYPKTSDRSMPYYLGTPFRFVQNSYVQLPEQWNVTVDKKTVIGDGFEYKYEVSDFGDAFNVKNEYILTKEYIEADSVADFLAKHESIKNELSFYVTQSTAVTEDSVDKISWISIILVVVTLIFGVYGALKLNRTYNPEKWEFAENKAIGGWLVFPAIGVTLSPFILFKDLYTGEYYRQSTWIAFYNNEDYDKVSSLVFLGAEIIYNHLLLIFSVLVLIQYYRRRTSLPRLITIFYTLSLFGPIVDALFAQMIFTDQSFFDDSELIKTIFKSFIAAVIWIPYFNISERVKSTFCKMVTP
ncbi:DUF3857 domain-containing protein [Reichenbachiella versicolor]|uniref:DUF3857 domain-containing protein n=1 Tax=Reichenbachiella versicolor TaxID=1821036 RepID=UPI000D6DCC80|nr:DUF3857 domain-containing protein [Reichenbachiella versicolor]